jgi:selenocysteine lyase/cysteine desulfurase
LSSQDRRSLLRANLAAIREYETSLCRRLLEGLAARPRFRVWGIADRKRLHERAPTVSITCRDRTPLEIAQHLADREIYAWNGNFYALNLTERLGLEDHGGLLRLGFAHYNTMEEVERLLQALDQI